VKKTRNSKRTIFAVIEGYKTERILLSKLITLYMNPSKTNIQINPTHGGTPSSLVDIAINNLNYGYDKVFVWIDEDKGLKERALNKLAKCWKVNDASLLHKFLLKDLQKTFNHEKKNPILVVSQPICVESIYLTILGKNNNIQYQQTKRASQIKTLKDQLSMITGKDVKKFVEENIKREMIEIAREKVPELDLIIKILS